MVAVKKEVGKRRLTKNEKRRLRRKLEKMENLNASNSNTNNENSRVSESAKQENIRTIDDLNVDVEYVSQSLEDLTSQDELAMEFKTVFKKFLSKESDVKEEEKEPTSGQDDRGHGPSGNEGIMSRKMRNDKKIKEEEERQKRLNEKNQTSEKRKLSKKEKKKMKAESVSALKQEVDRPDLVESHDVSSHDPKFLIYLKSLANTAPVPRHWSSKHRYLSHKRTNEGSRYQLPDFLKDAGVRVTQRANDEVAGKTAKQLARERTRPRLGKIDLDYQRLHDAFFKHQRKFYLPKLRQRLKIHNQIYYENQENEGVFRHKRMNVGKNRLSNKLKTALGMTSALMPPPWLLNMQKFGPPPSYPGLKIPGLNSPIPNGASFGFHVHGWGKPPVDVHGRPVYGMDVFNKPSEVEEDQMGAKVSHWGEILSDDEEVDSDSGSEMEVEDDEEVREAKVEFAPTHSELTSKTQASSKVPEEESDEEDNLEVDRALDLRKAAEGGSEEKRLFKRLEEKKMESTGILHASSYGYDVSSSQNLPNPAGVDEEADLSSILSKAKDTNKHSSSKSSSATDFKF